MWASLSSLAFTLVFVMWVICQYKYLVCWTFAHPASWHWQDLRPMSCPHREQVYLYVSWICSRFPMYVRDLKGDRLPPRHIVHRQSAKEDALNVLRTMCLLCVYRIHTCRYTQGAVKTFLPIYVGGGLGQAGTRAQPGFPKVRSVCLCLHHTNTHTRTHTTAD